MDKRQAFNDFEENMNSKFLSKFSLILSVFLVIVAAGRLIQGNFQLVAIAAICLAAIIYIYLSRKKSPIRSSIVFVSIFIGASSLLQFQFDPTATTIIISSMLSPIFAILLLGGRLGLIAGGFVTLRIPTVEWVKYIFSFGDSSFANLLTDFPEMLIVSGAVAAITFSTVHFSKIKTWALTRYKEALNMRTRFMANMTHEIRTPLNGIIGSLELMKQETDIEKIREHQRVMMQSAMSLKGHVEDILDFSKINTNELSIELGPVSVKEIAGMTCNLFQNRAKLRNVKLNYFVEPNFPEYIESDSTRLSQILNNLVSNAIKATKNGKVEVSVTRNSSKLEDFASIAVKDNGVGIAPEHLQKIFLPFEQIPEVAGWAPGGTGLGLGICKNLAVLLGGELTVESEIGKGSVFHLSIPLKQLDNNKPIPKPSLIRKTSSHSLSQLKILVVEDNKINRNIACRLVSKLGAETDSCENGKEALEKVDQFPFDIIFMDLQMPVMDGIEATGKIRQNASISQPVIIALTANAIPEVKETCMKIGMDGFLTKPILKDQLATAIEKFIETESSVENDFQTKPILHQTN